MSSLLKGILCVIGGFLLHFTLGSVYTFGNMSPYISSYMRVHSYSSWITNGEMLWIYAFSIGFQGISMTVGGLMEKKLGARITCLIGCWTMSLSVMLTYFTIQQNIYLVVLTYGSIVGLGTGLAYSVAIAEAIKWFPNNRGLIIGIVVAGFGLGSLVFNQVQTAFINPLNLSPNSTFEDDKYFINEDMLQRIPFCFLLIGGIYAFLQLIGCILLLKPSTWENEEQLINIQTLKNNMEYSESDILGNSREMIIPIQVLEIESISPRQALCTRDFWLLWFTFILNGTMNIFITSLYKTFGQLFIKNDFYLAIVGSIASIFNATGRILWGQIMDKFSYKVSMRTLTIIVIIFSSTFGLCEYVHSSTGAQAMHLIWVCIMLGSICGIFAILPSATVKVFGTDNIAIIYGILFTANGIAGLIGALSTTFLKFKLNYLGIFELGAGMCLVAFILTFFHKSKEL